MIVGWWLVRGLYYPIYWGWSEPMEIPTNQAVQRNSRWFCTVLIWATKDTSIEWLLNRGQYPWGICGGLTIQISESLGFNQRIIWDIITSTGCKTMVFYRGFNHQICGFKHPNFRKMDLTCIWKGENSVFTSKIGNVTWFNYPDMGVFNLNWNMFDGCWGSIAYIKRLLVWWLSGTSRWEPCVMFAEVSISKWSKKPAKHRIWSRHGNENCSHSTFSNCYVHVLQIRSCLLFSPCFLGAFKDIFLTFHQLKGRWFIYRKWKPQHRLGHPLAQVKSGKVGKVVEVPRGPHPFGWGNRTTMELP